MGKLRFLPKLDGKLVVITNLYTIRIQYNSDLQILLIVIDILLIYIVSYI